MHSPIHGQFCTIPLGWSRNGVALEPVNCNKQDSLRAQTFLLKTKAHGSNKFTENVESIYVHFPFVIDPLNLTEIGK